MLCRGQQMRCCRKLQSRALTRSFRWVLADNTAFTPHRRSDRCQDKTSEVMTGFCIRAFVLDGTPFARRLAGACRHRSIASRAGDAVRPFTSHNASRGFSCVRGIGLKHMIDVFFTEVIDKHMLPALPDMLLHVFETGDAIVATGDGSFHGSQQEDTNESY